MKRLKLFILIFCACLSIPMGYLVWHTFRSMEQEEISELRYFAGTLFEQMEEDLAALVQKEEARAVDEYTYHFRAKGTKTPPGLARSPGEPYLLGYLQNNPDGSFQSPLVEDLASVPRELAGLTDRLSEVNRIFNSKRSAVPGKVPFKPAEMKAAVTKEAAKVMAAATKEAEEVPELEETRDFAQKYFDFSRARKKKSYLGRKERRVEEVSVAQALNIAPQARQDFPAEKGKRPADRIAAAPAAAPAMEEEMKIVADAVSAPRKKGAPAKPRTGSRAEADAPMVAEPAAPPPLEQAASHENALASLGLNRGKAEMEVMARDEMDSAGIGEIGRSELEQKGRGEMVQKDRAGVEAMDRAAADAETAEEPAGPETFRVEVDPMQSVIIDNSRIFIFRRIVIGNRIFRQGFVVLMEPFLRHMAQTHFEGQPLARFTGLSLSIFEQGKEINAVRSGTPAKRPIFSLTRTFPRPFSFIRATLTCDRIPRSAGRKTLNLMMGASTLILLLGLYAIYRSARTLVELSERRASFVSSVTHELKTPLTNIRMYIEMLEQGIARTREREQDYFRILGSESARLSRLINNVLEFSRLEKKKRYVDLAEGTLEEVVAEVAEVMQEKLRQEGFTLGIEMENGHLFPYDREMMIQVLINLVENSMKFGKKAKEREITIGVRPRGREMEIFVSDKGPGIPESALKKIFDDFFRVDSELVRNTRGTGIGLALVKRFVTAMGGRVRAANNQGAGCTITIFLPWGAKDRTGDFTKEP